MKTQSSITTLFRQKHNKLIMLLFIILIRISIDLSYIWVISPAYSYAGFVTQLDYFKLLNRTFLYYA